MKTESAPPNIAKMISEEKVLLTEISLMPRNVSNVSYTISKIGFFDNYEEGPYLPAITGATLKEAFEKAVRAILEESNRVEEDEEYKMGVPGTEFEWYGNPKLWALEDQTKDNGLYLIIAGVHTDNPGEESWYCKIDKNENGKRVPLIPEDFSGFNAHTSEGQVLSRAHSSAEEFHADVGHSSPSSEEDPEGGLPPSGSKRF